ncbi:MAG: 3-hydroxyacyl-CoA dehydrogenase/enoyl-CoA hydratase family protein [Acidobacteriota bacterium]
MTHTLNRVAVLGAGTMGAQIAAHFANVGIKTLLLDLSSEGSDRSALARRAVEQLSSMKPAPLYSPEKVSFIEVGNFEDDLPGLSFYEWIIECVVEKLEVKRQLWERVEAHRRPGTIVSTNTSGLPVEKIAEGRSEDFQKHWLGTHFFNPPRYMKLLELIPGSSTLPSVVETVAFVADRFLGKGIVIAKDRPNFVANRVGSFVAMRAMELMQELDLNIEEVDALTGPVIGFPRTATFRLADLVGIDIMLDVAENLYENVPEDPWRESFRPSSLMTQLVERDWKGRKTGQGFYKKEGEEILVVDPKTLEYRSRRKPNLPSVEMVRNETDTVKRIQNLLKSQDKAGAFLWPLFRDIFVYSAGRVPEITEEYYQIDRAMRWGFNWELGPFELWQALGAKEIAERIRQDEKELPEWVDELFKEPPNGFYTMGADHQLFFDLGSREYQVLSQNPNKIQLTILEQQDKVIRSNAGASLVDLGDGVACLEFHSKMNAIGADIVGLARWAVDEVKKNFLGLVIGNQGRDFSVGANLMLLLLEAQEGNWEEIDQMVRAFQNVNMSFRYSAKPVVAAPFQRVLAGGAEVCLGCDAVVASAETYIGLVEVGVGLVPAGGGTKEMLIRHVREAQSLPGVDLLPGVRKAFETIGRAEVSRSGEDAKRLRFLRPDDLIEIHPDRLLSSAKQEVLRLAEVGYIEPEPHENIPVLGNSGLAVLKVGIHLMKQAEYISEHDALIGEKLAYILTGGDLNHRTNVSEQYLLDLEREAFLALCGEKKTLERIQYTLKTGKPLRN